MTWARKKWPRRTDNLPGKRLRRQIKADRGAPWDLRLRRRVMVRPPPPGPCRAMRWQRRRWGRSSCSPPPPRTAPVAWLRACMLTGQLSWGRSFRSSYQVSLSYFTRPALSRFPPSIFLRKPFSKHFFSCPLFPKLGSKFTVNQVLDEMPLSRLSWMPDVDVWPGLDSLFTANMLLGTEERRACQWYMVTYSVLTN